MISSNLKEKKNKYILDINKFFNILKIKLNYLKASYKNNINKIESYKIFEKIGNNFEINDENEDKSDHTIFTTFKSSPILYKENINGNLFEALSKNDYLKDIDNFKDKLNQSLLNLKI